nr:hypothetical protein [Escherichia coli O25b:H4-ST131]
MSAHDVHPGCPDIFIFLCAHGLYIQGQFSFHHGISLLPPSPAGGVVVYQAASAGYRCSVVSVWMW